MAKLIGYPDAGASVWSDGSPASVILNTEFFASATPGVATCVPTDATSATTLGSPTVVARAVAAPESATSPQSLTSPTITPKAVASPENATSGQTLGSPAVTVPGAVVDRRGGPALGSDKEARRARERQALGYALALQRQQQIDAERDRLAAIAEADARQRDADAAERTAREASEALELAQAERRAERDLQAMQRAALAARDAAIAAQIAADERAAFVRTVVQGLADAEARYGVLVEELAIAQAQADAEAAHWAMLMADDEFMLMAA